MAVTLPGGVYLDADQKNYHDADGKPVDKKVVAEFEKLREEQQKDAEAAEALSMNTAELAVARKLGLVLAPALAVAVKAEAEPAHTRARH